MDMSTQPSTTSSSVFTPTTIPPKKNKTWLVLGLICLLLLIGAFYLYPTFNPGQAPQENEMAYYAIATDINNAGLCSKISASAYTSAGFNPAGYQISYLRSDCYMHVAVGTKNPTLCQKVKGLSTLFLDGSKVSPAECVKEIQNPDTAFGGTSGSYFNTQTILTQLGYSEEMVPITGTGTSPADRQMDWYNFYLNARSTPDFQNRLNQLLR